MFRLEKGAAIRQIRSYFDYTSPHCDLDLEDSEPTFRTDTPVPDAAPQRQVWPQQGHRIRKCSPVFWPDTSANNDVPPNWVWLQEDKEFRGYIRNTHILIMYALTLILVLNRKPFKFLHDLPAMMVYHHTKFGYKSLAVQKISPNHPDKHFLKFWPSPMTLTPNTVIQSLHTTLHSLWWCTTKLNLLAKE